MSLLRTAGEARPGRWHASLAEALDGLSADQARWSPAAGRPSVWSIVRHVTHWKKGLTLALDQDGLDTRAWDEADWGVLPEDDAAWDADREELTVVSRRLMQRLAAADDALLDRELPGFGGSIADNLAQLATHDAYHAGQVRALVKLREALAGD